MSKNIDFKFYTELDLVKGGADDKKKMRLGGVASTEKKDSDDETLKIDGMDISSFIGSFVNWQHKGNDDPSMIIGQVDHAEKRGNELYVEVSLFPESKVAQDVFKLAQILQNKKDGKKLGFSIEGRAVERDVIDNKIVRRSILSGIAVTPSPKNPSTLAQIIKGETNGLQESDYASESSANGGNEEFILDMKDVNGNRITVSKNFEIKIEQVSKSLGTESGAALMPESLAGGLKNTQKSKKIKKSFDNKDNNFIFKAKSDLYDFLFKSIADIDYQNAKQLYSFIEIYQKKNNEEMADLTADKINKAFGVLEALADSNIDIQKGEKPKEEKLGGSSEAKANGGKENVIEKMASSMKPMIAKGMAKEDIYKALKEDMEDDEEADDEDMEKAYKKACEGAEIKKSEDNVEDELTKAEARVAELKAQKEAKVEKANVDEISKKEDKGSDKVELLIKSMHEDFSKKFAAIGEINKAVLESNSDLQEKLRKSQEDLENLEGQSQGRRSVVAQSYIEKGANPSDIETPKLSVSKNRADIIAKAESFVQYGDNGDLDPAGKDYKLLKAINDFSYGKPLSNMIVEEFKTRGIGLVQ